MLAVPNHEWVALPNAGLLDAEKYDGEFLVVAKYHLPDPRVSTF